KPLPAAVETRRLTLRVWEEADVPVMNEAIAANMDRFRPFLPWVTHEPMDDEARAELVINWQDGRKAGSDAHYTVFHQEDSSRVIGGGSLKRLNVPCRPEIGYWIAADQSRKGYITVLSRALTTAALSHPGVSRVEIHHDASNFASSHVSAKLGYRRDKDV
ncbi:unnamed protein product, partial [Ascophyllum nodosum]